jgi:hypothetical protein
MSSSPSTVEVDDFDMDFDLGGAPTTLRPEAEVPASVIDQLNGQDASECEQKQKDPAAIVAECTSNGGSVLYFDIETIPDYDRQHLFGLPALPVVPPEQSVSELISPEEFLSQGVDEIKKWFSRNNPCEEWLQMLEATERNATGKKGNRKGAFEAISSARDAKNATDDAIQSNRKKMATTPEMCRIVALGLAVDDQQVISLVEGEDGVTEVDMIKIFWEMARKVQHFCGFNVANFDLPTIFVRSILLGIPASRIIDLSPYKNNVIDVMVARFGKIPEKGFGLKNVAKLCDIQVPCEGVDGSQVEELWQSNPALVGEYVASDVIVTRKLHRMYSGFFCI